MTFLWMSDGRDGGGVGGGGRSAYSEAARRLQCATGDGCAGRRGGGRIHGYAGRAADSNFVMPQDAWLRAAITRPGSRRVLHHIIVRVRYPAFYLAKEKPKMRFETRGFETRDLDIPSGDADARHSAGYCFKRDTWLFGLSPHMLLRGKRMKFELLQSDGTRETLLSVPAYDFNWQTGWPSRS